MNAEQKQRALAALGMWHSSNDDSLREYQAAELMAALLQERVDAPTADKLLTWTPNDDTGDITDAAGKEYYFARENAIAMCRVVIAAHAPEPAPSVPDGWRLVPYTPTVLMLERAEYAVNNRPQPSKYEPSAMPAIIFWTAMLNYAPEAPQDAEPPADVELQAAFDRGLKAWNEQKEAQQVEIHRLHDLLAATPTQPEPPAELPTWENGDDPLVGGGLISRGVVDFATVGIWPTKPAPSVPDGWRGLTDVEWMNIVNFDSAYSSYDKEGAVNEAVKRTEAKLKELNAAQQQEPPADLAPDGWRSAIAKEFPLYDEDEIDEDKHCCEWVMLQERKRLHKILAAAPTPAEAPADVARDAERWRMLPAFLEEFEISYLRLEDAIDAAMSEKGGAK